MEFEKIHQNFPGEVIKSQFSIEEKNAKPIYPKNNQWFAEEQETNSEKLKKLKEWEFYKNEFNKITENQENLISVEEEDHKIKEEYKNDSFNALANRPFYLELVEMNDLEEAKIYYDELPFLEFRKKIIIFKA